MKKIILLTILIIVSNQLLFAQNNLKAQIEFEEAEKVFSENKFEEAYIRLNKTEELIGKWAPNISYLKIKSLDQLCDYSDIKNSYTQGLAKEVQLYMKFSNDHANAVVMDKFKEVYAIEEKLSYVVSLEENKNDQDFKAAEKAYEDKDFLLAITLYKKGADKGNTLAMQRIGDIHYYAKIEDLQSNTDAITWYKKAADKGNADAMYRIGFMYFDGKDIPQNYQEALTWFKKGAEHGNADAMNLMGLMYSRGLGGITKDQMEAVKWHRKGADKGNVGAMFLLATRYRLGLGITKDITEAMNWYIKAAENGYEVAMDELSTTYYNAQNYTEAMKWLKKSAAIGYNSRSKFLIGEMYYGGSGVTKDYTEAMNWYKKAADKDNDEAMLKIG
ncbi:MAG: tetratricopeptide repeat protein, partial [Bacteroidota bacterium]|nr:tetratricopeptide repeat protein [Bacteroidota bacterium]